MKSFFSWVFYSFFPVSFTSHKDPLEELKLEDLEYRHTPRQMGATPPTLLHMANATMAAVQQVHKQLGVVPASSWWVEMAETQMAGESPILPTAAGGRSMPYYKMIPRYTFAGEPGSQSVSADPGYYEPVALVAAAGLAVSVLCLLALGLVWCCRCCCCKKKPAGGGGGAADPLAGVFLDPRAGGAGGGRSLSGSSYNTMARKTPDGFGKYGEGEPERCCTCKCLGGCLAVTALLLICSFGAIFLMVKGSRELSRTVLTVDGRIQAVGATMVNITDAAAAIADTGGSLISQSAALAAAPECVAFAPCAALAKQLAGTAGAFGPAGSAGAMLVTINGKTLPFRCPLTGFHRLPPLPHTIPMHYNPWRATTDNREPRIASGTASGRRHNGAPRFGCRHALRPGRPAARAAAQDRRVQPLQADRGAGLRAARHASVPDESAALLRVRRCG